jgi:hypothetical protein
MPLPSIKQHEQPSTPCTPEIPPNKPDPIPQNPAPSQRSPFATPIKNTVLTVISPISPKKTPINREAAGLGPVGSQAKNDSASVSPQASVASASISPKSPLASASVSAVTSARSGTSTLDKGLVTTPLKSPIASASGSAVTSTIKSPPITSPSTTPLTSTNIKGTGVVPAPSTPLTSTTNIKGTGVVPAPSTLLTVQTPVSAGGGGDKEKGIEEGCVKQKESVVKTEAKSEGRIEKGSIVEGNFDNQGA